MRLEIIVALAVLSVNSRLASLTLDGGYYASYLCSCGFFIKLNVSVD